MFYYFHFPKIWGYEYFLYFFYYLAKIKQHLNWWLLFNSKSISELAWSGLTKLSSRTIYVLSTTDTLIIIPTKPFNLLMCAMQVTGTFCTCLKSAICLFLASSIPNTWGRMFGISFKLKQIGKEIWNRWMMYKVN